MTENRFNDADLVAEVWVRMREDHILPPDDFPKERGKEFTYLETIFLEGIRAGESVDAIIDDILALYPGDNAYYSPKDIEGNQVREGSKGKTPGPDATCADGPGVTLVDGIIVVGLDGFTEETAENLVLELDAFALIETLVLDLRGHTGGLLKEAIEIADLFIEDGHIVSIAGRNGADIHDATYAATRYPNVEIFVLVDSFTASGAEILTEALRQNRRAVVVGQPTHGHGRVNSVIPLDNSEQGFLQIWTKTVTTADGQLLDGRPLIPDVRTAEGDCEAPLDYVRKFANGKRDNYARTRTRADRLDAARLGVALPASPARDEGGGDGAGRG